MKVTFVERQYENKVFPKGQLMKFALKLARFCNLSIAAFFILIHRKGDDFETSTLSTVDDLMNICEIGKTISCLAFHSSFNIIKFRLQLYSNALHITYNIKGDIENAQHIIFLTENTLELTRLSEQATVRSIGPSMEGIRVRVGGCQSDEATSELVQLKLNIETSVTKASSGGFRRSRTSQKEHLAAKVESTPTKAEYGVPLPLAEMGVSRLDKREFIEIEESLFDLMKQVYERETENSVGSFDKYFNQVIKSRCQERIADY